MTDAAVLPPVSEGSGLRSAESVSMTGTPLPASTAEPGRYSTRRRVSRPAWALAIALHILVIGLLAIQKNQPFARMAEQSLKTFLLPEANDGQDESAQEQQLQKKEETTQRVDETPPPPAAVEPPPPPPVVKDVQMPFIVMSSADFAASNIARIPSQRRTTGVAQGDSKAAYGPGASPGGGSLFPADWYREPTQTELAGYLRPNQPSKGWGQIACKTIERYKVDECYVMGESPMGSGFGRSVLNASWQFMVQPPRINGRAQVGAWVSIRITYSPDGVDVSPGG